MPSALIRSSRAPSPASTGDGVEVLSGSAGDTIGYSPADGNSAEGDDIYGNGGWGIRLDPGSGPTAINANYIGTDTSGHQFGPGTQGYGNATALPGNGPPNGNGAGGVLVAGSAGDAVGGVVPCHNAADVCDSNIISGNLGPGVQLAATSSLAHVAGNYIGLGHNFYLDGSAGLSGGSALGNRGPGVEDLGTGNVIGGTSAAAQNFIAGNAGNGVLLEGSQGFVQNNLMRTDLGGSAAVPNAGAGVRASDGAGVMLGSNTIKANVIGGNTGPGVQLDQAQDRVIDNSIGTAGDRSSPLPNASGILAHRGPETIALPRVAPNLIAHNLGVGLAVVRYPGASSDPTNVNAYQNSIFANGGLGIDLGNDGLTQNHPLGTAAGPNDWQNFPLITWRAPPAGTTRSTARSTLLRTAMTPCTSTPAQSATAPASVRVRPSSTAATSRPTRTGTRRS